MGGGHWEEGCISMVGHSPEGRPQDSRDLSGQESKYSHDLKTKVIV